MLTLNQLCRTCLISNDGLLPIFEINLTDAEHPLTVADLLQSFTSILIKEGDGLPQQVCVNCLKQIKLIYEFKIKCQRAEAILLQKIREVMARTAMSSKQGKSSGNVPVEIPVVGTKLVKNPNYVPSITSVLRMNDKQSVSSLIGSSIDSTVLSGKNPAAMSVGSTTIIPISSSERVPASNSKKLPINPPEVLLQPSKPNYILQAESSSYGGVPVIPLSRILQEVKSCESALKDPALSLMQNSSAKLFKVQLDQNKIKTIAAIKDPNAHSKVAAPISTAPPPSSEHDYASRTTQVTAQDESTTVKMSGNSCDRSAGTSSILFDAEADGTRKQGGMQTELGSSLRNIVASMEVAASQKPTSMNETTTQIILNSSGSSGAIVISNITPSQSNIAMPYMNQPVSLSAAKSTISPISERPILSVSKVNVRGSAVPTLINNQKHCTKSSTPLQSSAQEMPTLNPEIASITPDVNISSNPMLVRILNSVPLTTVKRIGNSIARICDIPIPPKDAINFERMSKVKRKCPGCDQQFTDASCMLKHFVAEHTKGSDCLLCHSKGIRAITKHCEVHLPEIYFCADCNKGYPNHRKLREHLELASKSKHYCSLCDACFCVQTDYERHLRKHEIESSKSGEIFVCCSQEFLSANEYKSHMIKNHQGNEAVKCESCSKTFPNLKQLKVHKRNVHKNSNEIFKCSICQKSVKGLRAFNSHMIANHTSPKEEEITRRRCEICFAIFDSVQRMRRHQQVHAMSLSFNCPLCRRPCASSQSLKEHIESFHSTVRPYRCNLCRVAFKLKRNLQAHLLGEMHKKNKAERAAGKCPEAGAATQAEELEN